MKRDETVLKLAVVERELGVSRWTLYEWLKSGQIKGIKLPGGHYRIPMDEVLRLKNTKLDEQN